MKKKLKKLFTVATALTAVLSLTACGGGEKAQLEEDIGGTEVQQELPAEVDGSAVSADNVTLAEYLAGGESVWYLVRGNLDDLDKDDQVEKAYIIEPDGSVYCGALEEMTLGDITQMELEEVKGLIYEANRELNLGSYVNAEDISQIADALYGGEGALAFLLEEMVAAQSFSSEEMINPKTDEEFAKVCSPLWQAIDSYAQELYTSSMGIDLLTLGDILYFGDSEELIDEIVSDPALLEPTHDFYGEYIAAMEGMLEYINAYETMPGQYKMSLDTDQTGNQTEMVFFSCGIPTVEGTTEVVSVAYRESAGEPQPIYDATYGGVSINGGSLVTQMEDSFHFILEQPGESGLPADVNTNELFS